MASALNVGGIQDVDGPVFASPSTWRNQRTATNSEAQTKNIKLKENTTQTREKVCQEGCISEDSILISWLLDCTWGGTQTQTVAVSESKEEEGERGADLMASASTMPPRLQDFILSGGASMLKELGRGQNQAWEEFLGQHKDNNTHTEHDATLKYTLWVDLQPLVRPHDSRASGGANAGLVVTGLSWNASGSLLAASYGRYDLDGWCETPGALCVWSVFKRQLEAGQPDFVYEHSSCLMSVACHPEQPSLIAAGSFNGEVLLLDVSSKGRGTKGGESEGGLVAASAIHDYFHREPVVKLSWVWDLKERAYQLASISGDGKVLFWSVANKLAGPVHGHTLHSATKSKAHRSRGKKGVLGLAALSFPMEGRLKASLLVGSEGGAVMSCVLPLESGGEKLESGSKWSSEAHHALQHLPPTQRTEVKRLVESKMRELKITQVTLSAMYESGVDPLLLFPPPPQCVSLESHAGPVYCLHASPFHRHLFVSAGADGQARIYSVLQAKPLLRLEPLAAPLGSSLGVSGYLHAACWSPSRPMVLATGADTGHIAIYDLCGDVQLPVLELSVPPPSPPHTGQGLVPCYALAFNPKVRDLLACGDGLGRVHVYGLPWALANLQPSEHQKLQRLAGTADR